MKKLLLLAIFLPIIIFGQNLSEKFPNEEAIKSYLNNSSVSEIEGIYQYNSQGFALMHEGNHRLGLVWDGEKFVFLGIDQASKHVFFPPKGEVLELGEGSYSLSWFKSSNAWWPKKGKRFQSTATIANNTIIFTLPVGPAGSFQQEFMHKVFSSKNEIKRRRSNSNIWENNGSGFLISKSGYIATNHHVIDGWSQFKVEFKRNNKLEVFNARLVQSDKTNDLAILKIEDESFSTINKLAYNFKLRSVDIGTEIFALGYPLTDIMGDDIKFTDGKISSKTGYGGDVTTYQIQVPIQPGNSGGPLFDFKGNLIGVTSSGINRKLDLTENVNYAIKTSYLFNLIDVLPETITLPSSTELASKKLTDQIKILSDYVVIIQVK